MGTLRQVRNNVCPGCEGEMRYAVLEELWICQRPCGFQTASHGAVAWATLYSLMSTHRALIASARAFDAALPESNIIREVRRFLQSEEL